MAPATNYPYPDVPNTPGVPTLARNPDADTDVGINLNMGNASTALGQSAATPAIWGIYDQSNKLVAASSSPTAVQTVTTFEYTKEMEVATMPIEEGGFTNFNKVEKPAEVNVTLSFQGTQSDRAAFLSAIEKATESTNLYNIVTPEGPYNNYSINRFNVSRTASRGATLLSVDLSISQIRTASASFSQTTLPITNPVNADATSQTNNGITQAQTPSTSALKSLMNKLGGN